MTELYGGYSAAIHAHLPVAMANLLTQLEIEEPATDAPDPGPRRTPRDLRLWLARLRLLESVPFSHLVADSALLPPESIRFFHLDRAWTDSLVEGALSVGTVTTLDHALLEKVYPVVRDEVDEAERLVRLVGWTPGKAVPAGDAGPVTGFLLRSRLVSGWPALSVRGYAVDNRHPGAGRPAKADTEVSESDDALYQKLSLLRFERLAPAVLLVLFDGLPRVVHIEEPRAGVQYGVNKEDAITTTSGGTTTTKMQVGLRDVRTSDPVPWSATPLPRPAAEAPSDQAKVTVPFRRGAPGVVHIGDLLARISVSKATGVSGGIRQSLPEDIDSAELAMQLLRFPWRSVYGDQDLPDPVDGDGSLGLVFRPTIDYAGVAAYFADPVADPLPVAKRQWLGTPGGR